MIGCTIPIPLTLPRELDILFAPGSRFVGDRMRFDQLDRLRIDCNRQHIREGRSHGHVRFSVRRVRAAAIDTNRTRRHAAPAGVGLSRGVPGAIRLTARRAARRSQGLGGAGRDGFAYWRHAVSKAPPAAVQWQNFGLLGVFAVTYRRPDSKEVEAAFGPAEQTAREADSPPRAARGGDCRAFDLTVGAPGHRPRAARPGDQKLAHR